MSKGLLKQSLSEDVPLIKSPSPSLLRFRGGLGVQSRGGWVTSQPPRTWDMAGIWDGCGLGPWWQHGGAGGHSLSSTVFYLRLGREGI